MVFPIFSFASFWVRFFTVREGILNLHPQVGKRSPVLITVNNL